MNIEQAKRIPLADILHILGSKPMQQKKDEAWYCFRNERTASFKVNIPLNVWYDHGIGKGGDTIDLVCLHLEMQGSNNTISDALRWIKNMCGYSASIQPIKILEKKKNKPEPKLTIKDIAPLKHPSLLQYMSARGIPAELAKIYTKEVSVHNSETKKSSFAIGVRNEVGGWEIRNKFFKGCVGNKNITFIRGTVVKPKGINIFEGFMDFLSALMHKKGRQFEDDSLILNSLSCLKLATPYVKGYGYNSAFTWMDNDIAGRTAAGSLATFFETEENLLHYPMNEVYKPHKDVNDWHIHSLGLSQ